MKKTATVKIAQSLEPLQWKHGDNGLQDYWYFSSNKSYQVIRNHGQDFWVIYAFQGKVIRLVENPTKAHAQLRFIEVTKLPHAGTAFDEHPGDDVLPDTLSPNYAWDDLIAAMQHVEMLLKERG